MAQHESELFLLRIWAEPRELPGAISVYRGWLQHLRSGDSTYLRDLDQVTPFVERCLAEHSSLPPGAFADGP